MHTEQDRMAYNNDLAYFAHEKAVTEWLDNNPDIGVLNGGKYYRIAAGQAVPVKELS